MSLLLDALQRASKEKEKSADASAQANQSPQATKSSAEPLPAITLESWSSASSTPGREAQPPLSLEAPAVKLTAGEPQGAVERAEAPRPAPAVAAPIPPETKAAASPPLTMQPPPAPPSQTSARPAPGPGVAREILNATVKAQPPKFNKRLLALGVMAVLLTVTSATLFLIFRDDIPELSGSLQALISSPAEQRHGTPPPPAPRATEIAAIQGITLPQPAPVSSGAAPLTLPVAKPLMAEARQQADPAPAPPQEIAHPKIASHANIIPIVPIFVARPGNPDGALEAGYAALTEGRLDAAAEAYRRAIERNPDERDALLGLAHIAHRQGRQAEARSYYEQVLRLEPHHPVANAGLLTLLAEGDLQNATSRALELAERNPESAAAFATLGSLLVRGGRIADAQQAFFRAVTLEPGQPIHAYNLAVALDRLHKYELARSYYERSLVLAEKSAAGDRQSFPADAARTRLEELRIRESAERSATP
jgi:Flp pilus assembly protein TadD